MSTEPKYIFIRVSPETGAEVVNSCESLKDANYWLNYIAEPGDAMFITSSHPKHKGSSGPEYHSHLVSRRNVSREEQEWFASVKIDSSKICEIAQPK